MKQIFAFSFLLIALTACEKTSETTVKCWTCTQNVDVDIDGVVTQTQRSHDICGMNQQDIDGYEVRYSDRKLLDTTFHRMSCIAKDSI
jgi:hypothetical protein